MRLSGVGSEERGWVSREGEEDFVEHDSEDLEHTISGDASQDRNGRNTPSLSFSGLD